MAATMANLPQNVAFLGGLSEAVRLELGVEMTEIAERTLALQEARVPVKTGALWSALTIGQAVDELRIRVGLTDLKHQRGLWYAIIVEYGRRAGEKLVSRRARADGTARNGRHRRADDRIETYTMHWSNLAARPFVHIDAQADAIVDDVLGGFWDRVLGRPA